MFGYFNYVDLSICGMNIESFLLKMKNSGICLKDIRRYKYNEFYVKVSLRDYKKFIDFSNKMCYTIKVVKRNSLSFKDVFFEQNILFVGINICFNCFLFFEF